VILDASIILAIALKESGGEWARATLDRFPGDQLLISWVNVAEATMTFLRYNPRTLDIIPSVLARLSIIPLDLDFTVVRIASEARNRFPLNFGDCFAYAHAKLRSEALVTLDADFLKTDLAHVLHPSRG
jgi:ribonuclease VapC